MQRSVLSFLTALALFELAACGSTDVDAPSRMRRFVAAQKMDSVRTEEVLTK